MLRSPMHRPMTAARSKTVWRVVQTTTAQTAVAYRFDEHFTLRAGAENVANTYPDEATNQAVRGLIYSRNAPYDTDDGQYYVRLGVTF